MQNPPFTCVTWNVHRCVGNDKICDPDRTLHVLQEEVWQPGFQALVLTEADADGPPYRQLLDIAQIEAITGLRCVHTQSAHRWSNASAGFLGTLIFVHPSVKIDSVVVLDLPGWVHRGAVIVGVMSEGRKFRLIGTHLSLSQPLRWAQLRVIAQHIQRHDAKPSVLVGDLNEWRPWGGKAFAHAGFDVIFAGPAKATFPIGRPFLPLDRVLTTGPVQLVSTHVLDGPGIRLASDHRPLAAKVDLASLG